MSKRHAATPPPEPETTKRQRTNSEPDKRKQPVHLTDIIDFGNISESIQQVQEVFDRTRLPATTGLCANLYNFSDPINKLVQQREADLEEIKAMVKEEDFKDEDDVVYCSFSGLSEEDYDRLGVSVGSDAKTTDDFISTLEAKPTIPFDFHDLIQSFWDANKEEIVSRWLFVRGNVNTTSEAGCTGLVNEIMYFVIKFINGLPDDSEIIGRHKTTAVLIPQLLLGSKSRPAKTPSKSKATRISRTRRENGGTLVQYTVLTGSVDYGLFVVSPASHDALVTGTNNISRVFESRRGHDVSNFILLEAKRKSYGENLEDYIPQIIGESIAGLLRAGCERVPWCLTTGYDWIFGATKRRDCDRNSNLDTATEGFDCFRLAQDSARPDPEDKDNVKLTGGLQQLLTVLIYFTIAHQGELGDIMNKVWGESMET